MAETALFSLQDGRVVASELTRGPWSQSAQHGGAPAALIMGALEALPAPAGLAFARITFELLRPVPVAALSLEATVVRPGKRVQLLEATVRDEDGTEVVRARALQVRRAELRAPEGGGEGGSGGQGAPSRPGFAGSDPGPVPPGPESGRPSDLVPHFRPMFAPDAMEIRFVAGRFGGGNATAWFRLRVPVTDGAPASPLQRLAAAADFGNGVSSPVSWDDYTFINPDLTVYVEREPVGEWICLAAETRIPAGGIGLAESVLYDERGRIGRATQSLYVAPR